MAAIVSKIPPGATHIVSFLWKPIFCAHKAEAESRLAELGAADTPEEYFRSVDPAQAELMFPIEKVIKLNK